MKRRRPSNLIEDEGGPEHYSWSLTGPGEDLEVLYEEDPVVEAVADPRERYAQVVAERFEALRRMDPASVLREPDVRKMSDEDFYKFAKGFRK